MKAKNERKMRRTYIIVAIALLLSSCAKSPNDDEQGQRMLNEARAAYAQGNYAAARDTIMSLREHYPRALDARRQAILLLDSVELKEAQQQQDSLKTEFFLRKLEYDKREQSIKNK